MVAGCSSRDLDGMTSNHDDSHPGVVETRLVHDVHRRATSLLADAAGHAPVEELAEFRQFVVGMLRHHHHSEDTDLWPLLTAADPAVAAALEQLSQEHQLLDDALDELDDTEIGEVGGRDRLRGAATDLRDLVHEHLSHEEPILFPSLSEHIAHHVWDGFSQRTVVTSPPAGNHLMVALLDEVGTREQVELVLRHVPAANRAQLPAMRAQARQTLAALRHRSVIGTAPAFGQSLERR
jgi:hemerythrin-like domain-containing protein